MKSSWIPLALLLACSGCATSGGRSPVADSMGFRQDSRMIDIGPYRIHYGTNGTNDYLLVAEGGVNRFAKSDNTITAYIQGRPFLNYASGTGEGIGAYMIHIRDEKGTEAYTLMDENADGIFDRKVDYGTRTVYFWKNGAWVSGAK